MTIGGTYDDANIFAKILRGELPCVKVYDDADVLAFMDLYPQARGHTLVLPRNVRARNFLDFPPERIAPLLLQVQRIARAVNTALSPDGISILQFNGAPAGQTVFHLHFHILPRYEGVKLAGHGHGQRAELAELVALAKQIADAM